MRLYYQGTKQKLSLLDLQKTRKVPDEWMRRELGWSRSKKEITSYEVISCTWLPLVETAGSRNALSVDDAKSSAKPGGLQEFTFLSSWLQIYLVQDILHCTDKQRRHAMSRWNEEIEIDGEDWTEERREVGSTVIDLIPFSANSSTFAL